MLLAVLLYGYCGGVFSSRRLAAHCETEVAFSVLIGGAMPDFRTLSDSSRGQDFEDARRAGGQPHFLFVGCILRLIELTARRIAYG
jgi:hypothetical protein